MICLMTGVLPALPAQRRDRRRIRAFARYAGAFGQVALLDCLAEGERRGLSYHYPGKLTGDYDSPGTEEDIFALLCALGG